MFMKLHLKKGWKLQIDLGRKWLKFIVEWISIKAIIKQRGTVAIPFANPARLSIFWKQNRNSLQLKQSILFPKNHDNFSLIITVILIKNNKQNFVKGKITKYECISFAIIFIMIELIYVKIILVCESERSFTKRVLFFLYKKVLH